MFRTSSVHPQELVCKNCICRLWYVVRSALPDTSSWYNVVLSRLLDHTDTQHCVSLPWTGVIATQRLLPDNIHHSQETNIRDQVGFETKTADSAATGIGTNYINEHLTVELPWGKAVGKLSLMRNCPIKCVFTNFWTYTSASTYTLSV